MSQYDESQDAEYLDAAADVIGGGYRGSLCLLARLEGVTVPDYNPSPYFPGGKSGVTLHPGIDLGQVRWGVVVPLYWFLRDSGGLDQLKAIAYGKRGAAARAVIDSLADIHVDRDHAIGILPIVASGYWARLVMAVPSIADKAVPVYVQEVALSMAYNRGPSNKDVVRLLSSCGDWGELSPHEIAELGVKIAGMQPEGSVGVRNRRYAEGCHVITGALPDIMDASVVEIQSHLWMLDYGHMGKYCHGSEVDGVYGKKTAKALRLLCYDNGYPLPPGRGADMRTPVSYFATINEMTVKGLTNSPAEILAGIVNGE